MKINKLIKELKRIKKQSGNHKVGLMIHFEKVDIENQTQLLEIRQCLHTRVRKKSNNKHVIGLKLGMYLDQENFDKNSDDYGKFMDCKGGAIAFENGI